MESIAQSLVVKLSIAESNKNKMLTDFDRIYHVSFQEARPKGCEARAQNKHAVCTTVATSEDQVLLHYQVQGRE